MQQIQGEWAIIGVLGMVLFIVVIGKKIQMLLNFMIRIVLGGIGIIYANDFFGKENYQLSLKNGVRLKVSNSGYKLLKERLEL
mgnify:CR=1 FL=1